MKPADCPACDTEPAPRTARPRLPRAGATTMTGRAPAPGPRPSRLMRALAVWAAGAVLAAGAGCDLRVGEGSPASLPTIPASEAARDHLARHAVLIASTAQALSSNETAAELDPQALALATALDQAAQAQQQALGGVWQPWPTAVPSQYPTASPVATAAADATMTDLVTALTAGAAAARQAGVEAGNGRDASLYASLHASWTAWASMASPDSVTLTPRSAPAMTAPLSQEALVAYDQARYALESVAARSSGDQRTRAADEAVQATAVVNASVALGGADARLPAYAAPAAPSDPSTSLDVTWAQQAWLAVADAEVVTAGVSGGAERAAALDAAADATARAAGWGAAVPALPGYPAGA